MADLGVLRRVAAQIETHSRPASPLASLLHARSVAIVGLSQPGKFGGQVYANLKNLDYPGAIFGVNPSHESLYDQPCYPSLKALPQIPDCAILGVSNERLIPALREAAEMGVPSAVIFASAHAVQEQLAEIARAHRMVVCGPNGMGFVAFGQRLAASGYPVIPTPPGNIALITHSGSVFDALAQNNRGVRFNYAISPGNEMVTTMTDYLHFVLDDPTTRIIALFLETVRDPQNFVAALDEAARCDIPVIALKVGRTEHSARLALAHSGALAGEDAVFDAVFARYGVQRVKSLDEMMDTLELFASGLRTPTRHVSAIFDSGGERSLFVDLADSERVAFAPLTDSTRVRLAAVLDPGLEPVNPLDAWGTLNNFDHTYAECLKALDADPETGLTLFAVDLSRVGNLGPGYSDIVLSIQSQLTRPLAFVVNVTATAGEAEMVKLRQAGIPVLMGTETALRAVRHLLDYSHYQRAKADLGSDDSGRYRKPAPPRLTASLDEFASKQLLDAYGILTPKEVVVTSLAEALQAADRIGWPVALKTANGELHKSERGGVHLNLQTPEALSAAYRDLEARLGPRTLVQQMITGGVEMILGIANDSQFGLMLVVGLGGIFVEVLQDRRLVMLPASSLAIREALLGLRGAAILNGTRGKPPVDVDAVVDAARRLSALALDLGEGLAEIDLNPLLALPRGAVVVDALILLKQS